MDKHAAGNDYLRFLRAWAAKPLQIAAISPSGTSLASLITSEIGPGTGPVLELGPGTGAFTRAIIQRGVDESALTLIEFEPDFARLLEQRFPAARIIQANAARLYGIDSASSEHFGAVVSGLPLLSMRTRAIMAILKLAFSHMSPTAAFYQFTYGPRCPVPQRVMDRLGLKGARIGKTMLNLPPASVYRITKRRKGVWEPVKQTAGGASTGWKDGKAYEI